MPDIDFQKIELNLIPKKGDKPVVFYASQYETARTFIAVLKWGDTEYAPGVDSYAEIDIRKNDDNLVVITDDVTIDNNEVSVILPVQAVTCIGKNLGQVKIYAGEDQFVAAFNFILEVQADPLAGGVTSETAIDNLTQQIEDITQQVIGDDYYNKTQTDALLANKANVSDLPDMTDYYTKTQTDNLLNDKADRTDLATLASKAEVTQAINDEDTALKNWAYTQFATPGYVASNYYDKSEVDNLIDNIFPTLTASGAIANFKTALNKPLVSVTADPGATTITRCGANLVDFNLEPYGVADEFWLPEGNYYCSLERSSGLSTAWYFGAIKTGGTYCTKSEVGLDDWATSGGGYLYGNADKDYFAFTIPAGVTSIKIGRLNADNTIGVMINVGSTASQYEAYNGQTVPVADATTLITLSGVNNVFADSGDVTVQYKYMSI